VGLLDVLRSYKVYAVMEPGTIGASAEYQAFEKAIEDEGAKHLLARRGQKISLGGGAVLGILFPDRDVSGVDTNTGSVVAKLIYGSTSFLLTGDAPEGIENYIVSLDGKNLDSDVLKVGHHGSKTSTGNSLLGYASPAMAVISVGKGNKFGHPNAETLERLKQFDVKTLRTDQLGTIIFVSDGENIKIK
jgi:competence protein ComEC